MRAILERCELFQGLDDEQISPLVAIARHQELSHGDYLFLLGDHADRLYVVLAGKVEVCFPLSFGGALRDVAVETEVSGGTLGWSALVRPYRFTLSARAAERCEVAAFLRQELLGVLDRDCRLGRALLGRIAEMTGRRLLTMQALLARELQRTVAAGWGALPDPVTGQGGR
jgi:CRP/FNR family cyclic AMP-dependent transcriptional regulator